MFWWLWKFVVFVAFSLSLCALFAVLFSLYSSCFFFTFFFTLVLGNLIYNRAVPGNFHSFYSASFSASFPFCMISVEHLISIVTQSFCKMFRLVFIVVCFLLTVCQSCRLIVPAELLNGCIFDPMIVSVSHAGFSINRDNCNSAIAKHVFAEQPLVYYGRAKSVILFIYLVKSINRCCIFFYFYQFLNSKENCNWFQKWDLIFVFRSKNKKCS